MSIPITVFESLLQDSPYYAPRSQWEMMGHPAKKSGVNVCRPAMDM